jgi:hypothetical protein
MQGPAGPTDVPAAEPAPPPPSGARRAKPSLRGPEPQLDPSRIIDTVRALRARIGERFPGSGLGSVAEDLLRIAEVTVARVTWVKRPLPLLRGAAWLFAALVVVVVFGLVATVDPQAEGVSLAEFLQAVEAGLNDVVLIGAAIFFLVTVEGRIKRRRALAFLRELRALAHIVDMHQLTKDPGAVVNVGSDTPSSPRRSLTPYELSRYLDYCSEMLALNSKLAALYAQNFDDPVVLGAVDEVETLSTGLSGKIWQKLVILNQPGEVGGEPGPLPRRAPAAPG